MMENRRTTAARRIVMLPGVLIPLISSGPPAAYASEQAIDNRHDQDRSLVNLARLLAGSPCPTA